QCRRPPTCGTKNFKTDLSSRRLIPVYFRFWVFFDCTFLDNSSSKARVAMLYGWFTRIMNRPKKVNAVAVKFSRKEIDKSLRK
ncbi:MAG: hypothetical protein KBA55_15565, partial [Ruminococcus sp.]|nr:hypothetical protein [Ruminococcus sp.]